MIKIDLIKIPAGKFAMGSTQEEVNKQIRDNPQMDKRMFERQLPQHILNLAEYQISKYPITNLQFAKFTDETKYKTLAEKENWGNFFDGSKMIKKKGVNWKHPFGSKSSIKNKMNHPVVLLSWFDCLEFCKWLSQETGNSFRLPKEAEWEKAARGPKGNLWPWGNKWNSDNCNCENKIKDTTQVGSYSPQGDSFYSCSDMAGNVLEWCSTTIGTTEPWPSKYNYPYNPNDGREDLTIKFRRVARGGTYQRGKDMCRCAFRFADMPNERYSSMGFRVVCS